MSRGDSDYYSWHFKELQQRAETAPLPILREAGLLSEETILNLQSYKETYSNLKETKTCGECGEETSNNRICRCRDEEECPRCRKTECDHCGARIKLEIDPEKPTYARNTPYWQQVISREIAVNLRRAVRNGRIEEVAFALGQYGEGSSGSGNVREYEDIRQMLLPPSPTLVYAGEQGGGKTADALRTAELNIRIADTRGWDLVIATNIKSVCENHPDRFTYCRSVEDLLDIRFSHTGPMMFIMDEASSYATGKGRDVADVADFGRFARRMRKLNITGIFIGHRLTDVAPDIRDLEGARFVVKPDQQTTQIWGDNPDQNPDAEKKLELNGLRDTYLSFKSGEPTSWRWDGLDRLNEMIEESDDEEWNFLAEEQDESVDVVVRARDVDADHVAERISEIATDRLTDLPEVKDATVLVDITTAPDEPVPDIDDREFARVLRSRGASISDIVEEVGRARSTVHEWVQDVPTPTEA